MRWRSDFGIHATLGFDGDDASGVSHRYLWGISFDMVLDHEPITSASNPGNGLWPLADQLGTIRDSALKFLLPSHPSFRWKRAGDEGAGS